MTNGEIVTHSHGTKVCIATVCWISIPGWTRDRRNYKRKRFTDELVRPRLRQLRNSTRTSNRWKKIWTIWTGALERASTPLGNAPLLASHPVYHYAATLRLGI